MNPRAAVAGLCLLAVALGACTATSSPPERGTSPTATSTAPSGPATSSAPATPSSSAPTTVAPSPSATKTAPTSSAPAPPAPVSSAPAPSSPVPARSSCTKLTIRVLLGSGAPGYEFAALQFVNDGSSACRLVGVPTVTLLRHGTQTGSVSQPNKDRARFGTYRLAPGAVAESKLKDFSSCNAPLSQSIRVVAPGSDITTTRPGQLRACKLVVYPLGAPE